MKIIMKCQKCNKNEANTHITKIVNGIKTEQYLCEKCAAENQDFTMFGSDFDKEFENFFSGFFGMPQAGTGIAAQKNARVCPTCGSTLSDISNRGKLGCSECYRTFTDYLLGPLKQIHGSNSHAGKIPLRGGRKLRKESELDRLSAELNRAVMEQNFEQAAVLRDKINSLREQA